MSLKEAHKKAPNRQGQRHRNGRVYRLQVDIWLDQMDDEDRKLAHEYLSDLTLSYERVADLFTEGDYPLSEGAVRTWCRRNGVPRG